MKTAKFVKRLGGWNGDARLFQLDPPMKGYDEEEIPFVIVSGVNVPFSGAETFIFPSDSGGYPKSFTELPGSFRGSIDHEKAIRDAGYRVVQQEDER